MSHAAGQAPMPITKWDNMGATNRTHIIPFQMGASRGGTPNPTGTKSAGRIPSDQISLAENPGDADGGYHVKWENATLHPFNLVAE